MTAYCSVCDALVINEPCCSSWSVSVRILHPADVNFEGFSYKSDHHFTRPVQFRQYTESEKAFKYERERKTEPRETPNSTCPNMVCCAALLDHRLNFCLSELWHQNLTHFGLEHGARKRNRILGNSPRSSAWWHDLGILQVSCSAYRQHFVLKWLQRRDFFSLICCFHPEILLLWPKALFFEPRLNYPEEMKIITWFHILKQLSTSRFVFKNKLLFIKTYYLRTEHQRTSMFGDYTPVLQTRSILLRLLYSNKILLSRPCSIQIKMIK